MKSLKVVLFALLLFAIIASGCGPSIPEPAIPEKQEQVEKPTAKPTDVPSEPAEEPTPASEPMPVSEPTPEQKPTVEVISADVQVVEFESTDGTLLMGEYYPPESGPAPVVVLMHQYPLDHEMEWFAIAPWLQNRGLTEDVIPGEMPWSDPSWFPAVADGLNMGVFVFTFRGCKGGCQNAGLSREEGGIWAEDARAALLYASTLPGADAERIVAVGTSIGADGAVDGCWLAEADGLRCAGAMSWSPGSYLLMPYAEIVGELTAVGVPVRCFAGEGDSYSAEACRSYTGDGFEIEIDPSSNHGIDLVSPNLEIETLDLLLAFLQETVGH